VNWLPVVTQATSEKNAWQNLYETNSTVWWELQGEPIFKKSSNMALSLKNELDKKGIFKTDFAQQPSVLKQGTTIIPKANY
jgi:hypothetical protein